MSRREENAGFICQHCGESVLPLTNGSYRNHCPHCMFSKHVDVVPGDRRSACGGLMAPVALREKSGKGLQVVHRCLECGHESVNRVAERTVQEDDIWRILELTVPLNGLPGPRELPSCGRPRRPQRY